MMKYFNTILFILTISLAFTQSCVDSISVERIINIEQNIEHISNSNSADIDLLKERIDIQQTLNEQTLTSISAQLDSTSLNLTVFGVLFAVLGLILGVYVTYVERKILKIAEQNQELLKESKQIKDHVDSVNKLIKNDLFSLFLKIKREETVHILDRLTQVPEDIANTIQPLLSRELQQEDFTKLRRAYSKLRIEESDYRFQYKIVFFQHFFAEVLKDEELKSDVSPLIDQLILSTFENDIIKTTRDFTSVIYEMGLNNFKVELNKYFKGLTASVHKDFEDVYTLLFTELKTRQTRFELFNIIESSEEFRYAKIKFGNLLQDAYANENPSELEKKSFEELESIREAQFKHEEEQRKKKEGRLKKQEEARKKKEEQQKRKYEQRAREDAINKAKEEGKKDANDGE